MQRPQWSARWPFIILSFIELLLAVILIAAFGVIDNKTAASIVVAAIVAISGWFIASILKTRLDVETKVHEQVSSAITAYTDSLTGFRVATSYVTRPSAELILRHADDESYLWTQHTLDFRMNILEKKTEVLNAMKKLRDTIEANELVIYRLQDIYRFIMINDENISKELDKLESSFLKKLKKIRTDKDYAKMVSHYSVLGSLLWDQQGFCVDFKYELNNLIYTKLFFVKLPHRKTEDGSKTIYDLDLKTEIDKHMKTSTKKY